MNVSRDTGWPIPDDPVQQRRRLTPGELAAIAAASGSSSPIVAQFERIAEQAPDLAEKVDMGMLALDRADRLMRDRAAADRRQDRAAAAAAAGMGTYDLRTGDFRDVLADLPDDSVDLILTDPPYGFEAVPIYGDLAKFGARVLKPGGSLITYAGQTTLLDVGARMTPHLRYWWTLSLDHRHGGQQLPGKFVIAEWKPLLWFVKDHRAGRTYVADRVRGSRPDKDAHEWAQGIEEVEYLIQQLTDPGDLVVDPFAGSGAFGVAAVNLGRRFIGADLDPTSATGRVVA